MEIEDSDSIVERAQAEDAAANIASESDEYIFVAELVTTHYCTKGSESQPYADGDA